MHYWGVRMRFKGREVVLQFGSLFQAEYYLHLIPIMIMDGNPMVDGIISARLVPIL